MDLATTYTIKAKVTGQESINGLNKGLGKVKESSNKAAASFNKLKSAGSSLMGVLGSIGATAAVTGFLKAGIDMQRTQKTLKILTEEYGEHERALEFVDEAAERFGIGQQKAARGVADLFGRLRPMGISLEQIQDTYLGLNNAALKMNLSTADTEGAMLQLSQALGSGVLQGDEFRSIMERLPAIGQAVADVMGVNQKELKQLSSDGELTTEKIIAAMQRLKEMEVPPPDSFKLYVKAMQNFSTLVGTKLLPAFTPFVNFLTSILEKFANLPAPLQTIIAGVTALSAGLVIIAPALGLIVTGLSAIGSVIGAVIPLFAPILAGGAIPLAIIGLGVIIFKFRDQIGQAFAAIGQFIYAPFQPFVQFIGNIFSTAINIAQNAFGRLPLVVQNAVRAATAPLRGFIKFLQRILSLLARVRGARAQEQGAGSSSSTTTTTSTSSSSSSSTSPFSPEFSSNFTTPFTSGYGESGQDMSFENTGFRPSSTVDLPEFQGGSNYIPSSNSSNLDVRELPSGGFSITNNNRNRKPPNVNIQTGDVRSFEGTNYVTTQDLQDAVQSGVQQTMNFLEADGVRYHLGM
jgi:tape measure domain-containing protein